MNKAYVPKFNKAFEHFLLHTGGRAVIDEMEEKLSLTPAQCQPSKDALYRFGNTSAASTWCAQQFSSYLAFRFCCMPSASFLFTVQGVSMCTLFIPFAAPVVTSMSFNDGGLAQEQTADWFWVPQCSQMVVDLQDQTADRLGVHGTGTFCPTLSTSPA